MIALMAPVVAFSDPDGPIVAGDGQPCAVRRNRHRGHIVVVASVDSALQAGGHVPDTHRLVITCTGQSSATATVVTC